MRDTLNSTTFQRMMNDSPAISLGDIFLPSEDGDISENDEDVEDQSEAFVSLNIAEPQPPHPLETSPDNIFESPSSPSTSSVSTLRTVRSNLRSVPVLRPEVCKKKMLDLNLSSLSQAQTELPQFDDENSYNAFLKEHTEDSYNKSGEFAYLKLEDVLLPGCKIADKIVKTDVLKFWSGYAYELLNYLRSDKIFGLHESLNTLVTPPTPKKEPSMYVDNQIHNFEFNLKGKIRLFSSPYIEVCNTQISNGNTIQYVNSTRDGGIYTHTCPLWLFENNRMNTSGKCRLDILADPDAFYKTFIFDSVPVGFQEEKYCAVQLKSTYVLFVYDTKSIRKALIDFRLESINDHMTIYKCIAVLKNQVEESELLSPQDKSM
jgi:hypothetical protein